MTSKEIRICDTNCKYSDGKIYNLHSISLCPCIYCTFIDFFHQQGEPCGVQIEVNRVVGSFEVASTVSLKRMEERKEE